LNQSNPAKALQFGFVLSHTRHPFFSCRFHSCTRGLPPFSSRNPTPAAARTGQISAEVCPRTDNNQYLSVPIGEDFAGDHQV
jgi:hypothetical protein